MLLPRIGERNATRSLENTLDARWQLACPEAFVSTPIVHLAPRKRYWGIRKIKVNLQSDVGLARNYRCHQALLASGELRRAPTANWREKDLARTPRYDNLTRSESPGS